MYIGLGIAASGVLNSGATIGYHKAAVADAWLKQIKFEEVTVSTKQQKVNEKIYMKILPKYKNDKSTEQSKAAAKNLRFKKFISLSYLRRRFDITGGAILV